jgi:co-chaperonin GroES (HSP10)
MNTPTSEQGCPFPIEPFEDICIIERTLQEQRASGLILAGGAQDLPCGRVVAAGPGRWYHGTLDASGHNSAAFFVPNPVKVGDFVIFGKFQSGGEPIQLDGTGKKYVMARAGDLGGKSVSGDPVLLRLAID